MTSLIIFHLSWPLLFLQTLDDCYGIADSAAGVPDSGRQVHGSNVVHQNIIKRFNQVKNNERICLIVGMISD